MFNSTVLDVVIGLVFIYLLYSLLATIVQEIVASFRSYRARFLEKAIRRMLQDENKHNDDLVNLFYHHPLMKYLGESHRHSKPSYINKETFSKVVVDLLRGDKVNPGDDVKTLIQSSLEAHRAWWSGAEVKLGDETVSYLKSLWADAQGDVDKFKVLLENWFNETMDRASGWFKRYTQRVLFIVGFVLAVLFNVNTIEIAHKLEKDPKLREQMVAQADNFVKAHPDLDKQLAELKKGSMNVDTADTAALRLLKVRRDTLLARAERIVSDDIQKTNSVLGIGVGSLKFDGYGAFGETIFGWILTALAISLGAPFWFDLLNKLMKLRSSVTSGSEEKKDKTTDGDHVAKVDRKG